MAVFSTNGFLTPKQVAEDLQTTEQQLWAWRQKKIGPRFIRRAGRIYYSENDVKDWWENGEETAA